MPNFIDDNTALPATKVDRRPIPPGGSATNFGSASDWNAVFSALEDTRDAVQGLQGGAFRKLAMRPAITPSALPQGSTHNYAPTGWATAGLVRQVCSPFNSRITGFGTSGVTVGDMWIIQQCGDGGSHNGVLTIGHLDNGSTASGQVWCPGGFDLDLRQADAAVMIYDGGDPNYRILAVTNGGRLKWASLGALEFQERIDITLASGDNDNVGNGVTDWNDTSRIYLSPNAGGSSITGMMPSTRTYYRSAAFGPGGAYGPGTFPQGTVKWLINTSGSVAITIKNNSGPTDTSKFYCPSFANATLAPLQIRMAIYDEAYQKWLIT